MTSTPIVSASQLQPHKRSKYSKIERLANRHNIHREITVTDQPIVRLAHQQYADKTAADTAVQAGTATTTAAPSSTKGEVHTISMLHRNRDVNQVRTAIRSNTSEYDAAMDEYRIKRLAEKRAIRQARHAKPDTTAAAAINPVRADLPVKAGDGVQESNGRSVKKQKLNGDDTAAVLGDDDGAPITAEVKHQKKKDEPTRQLERLQRKQARLMAEQQQDDTNTKVVPTNVKTNGKHKQPAVPKVIDTQRVDGGTVMIIDTSSSSSSSSSSSGSDSSETDNDSVQADDTAVERTKQPDADVNGNVDTAERPAWMYRGQQIDQSATLPVSALHTKYQFDERICTVLQQHDIHTLFPMQSHIVPMLTKLHGRHDVCVCSPTGTGKTLTYVLPIMQLLATRIVRRLRCVVVLPTRDLAVQVWRVFMWFTEVLNVQVGLAIGQTNFANEQNSIVDSSTGDSMCDVLVCTPGRLIEHIQSTKMFDLTHVKTLVLDEVDRLLTQQYNDFVYKVLSRIDRVNHTATLPVPLTVDDNLKLQIRPAPGSLQKLLFSATLTTNPQKLASLYLQCPLFYTETKYNKAYKLSPQLTEYMVQCDDNNKPLKLILLLQRLREQSKTPQQILIFTHSVQSTHRLYRLIELYGVTGVAEYSSAIQGGRSSSKVVEQFNSGKLNVLICSDVMARGMDFSVRVDAAVQYDVPVYIRTYVHRVGRTARAGAEGTAYTMVKQAETNRFKKLLQSAENSKLLSYAMLDIEVLDMKPRFECALRALRRVLEDERHNRLDARKALKSAAALMDECAQADDTNGTDAKTGNIIEGE